MSWFKRARDFFPPEAQSRIVSAIIDAEKMTSGEIRVHVQAILLPRPNLFRKAKKIFHALGMDETKERNGILFFIVPNQRRFIILGDEGIHVRVTQVFWDKLKDLLEAYFKTGHVLEGLLEAIALCGQVFKH